MLLITCYAIKQVKIGLAVITIPGTLEAGKFLYREYLVIPCVIEIQIFTY